MSSFIFELIFEKSRVARAATAQISSQLTADAVLKDIPAALRRASALGLPEVSELQVVRHYTNLSAKNFAIDKNFYPLGSCTMKYNPRGAHKAASLGGFLQRHPLAPASHSQGFLACMYDLQQMLCEITGMQAVSLTPMAGAQGEFAGVAMIRAYHQARGDHARQEMLVPTAAHGTNPATAVMCGYRVVEVPVDDSGDVDLEALKSKVGPQTAGLMLTNPSTCGVFERNILPIAKVVHEAGGLLYYDGANLNAIMGQARPGDMGFDVLHLNLHKTFATPHGGGGPGAGPVGASARLAAYLPGPTVVQDNAAYRFQSADEASQSIGRLSAFMGNAGVLLRAYFYARVLGREGIRRVGEFAALNANYLMQRLREAGFDLAYPERRATHEFIISFKNLHKQTGVSAMDMAKRLLDYGFHAPTTYFPLLIPECWLIEPTETEDLDTLDEFVTALITIRDEALHNPDLVKTAPHTLPVKRLDDVLAAKQLDLVWHPAAQ
jgi:glycine dehydrogenase subunit 2